MFDYELKDKHVILQFDPEFLPHLKFAGIAGTPLFAKVFKTEDNGLWLETGSFPLCPKPVAAQVDPDGDSVCEAHVFIPRQAILSVVAFPSEAVPDIGQDPQVHTIGFRPRDKKRTT